MWLKIHFKYKTYESFLLKHARIIYISTYLYYKLMFQYIKSNKKLGVENKHCLYCGVGILKLLYFNLFDYIIDLLLLLLLNIFKIEHS